MPVSKAPIRMLHSELAAEIQGVDVRDLDADATQLVLDVLVEHPLLVLRNQDLSAAQLAEFASLLGSPQTFPEKVAHPESAQVVELTNQTEAGQAAGAYWHADGLLLDDPPMLTAFYARSVAPEGEGGDTLFCSAQAAWDALAPADRDVLSELEAVYETGTRHPIVRMHPLTDRPAICVNVARTVGIVGATRESAAAVIRQLSDHLDEPERVYRHRYRPGDLLLWDNYALVHSATDPVDPRFDRSVLRSDIHAVNLPPRAAAQA
jgi:alpha-ketoglutarate-dependent taurine dioxygenase